MEQIFIDEETGECIARPLINRYEDQQHRRAKDTPVNNAETGEPEIGVDAGVQRRRVPFQSDVPFLGISARFQIPREIKEELLSSDNNNRRRKNDERFIDVEPVSGTSFAQTNPVFLFLLPILYFQWLLALLTILEVAFHIWTHHKNKSLKDTNVYFRSPFHGVTSEFCALCQNETCMDRVGKMQEIRMHKFLKHCNYMKRAVT